MSAGATPHQWRTLLAGDEDFRKAGYIGRIPYVLALRWFTVFGIFLRFFMHKDEYAGRLDQIVASIVVALLLAVLLTFWPLRPGRRFHQIEVLAVILADISIIFVAYVASNRLQSDSFLFFFLPLILAAEYLPGRWITPIAIVLTAALWGVMYRLQPVDVDAHMTLTQAFFRVYVGPLLSKLAG